MLPVAAAEIGGADIWPMALSTPAIISIACLPLFGYLSARGPHLRRPIFICCFAAAVTCMVIRGLATSIWMIIIPAFAYGLMAPAIFVCGYTLVRDMFGRQKAGIYLGFVATMQGTGWMLGALSTGFVVENYGWRYMYIFIVTGMLVAMTLMVSGVRASKEEGQRMAVVSGKFDSQGAVAMMVMLSSVVCTLSMINYFPWGSLPNLTFIAAAVVAGIFFVRIVRKKGEEAFMPVPVLKDKNTLLLFLVNARFTFSTIAASIFMPTYLMLVMMKSPGEAGIAASLASVLSIFVGPLLGRAIAKRGTAREIIMYMSGLASFCVQFALFIFLKPDTPIYLVYVFMFLTGIYNASGGIMPAVAPQIQLKEEVRVLGNSLVQLGGSLGSIIGICVFTALMAAMGPAEGFKTVLLITSTISILDLFLARPLKKLDPADIKKAESYGRDPG